MSIYQAEASQKNQLLLRSLVKHNEVNEAAAQDREPVMRKMEEQQKA